MRFVLLALALVGCAIPAAAQATASTPPADSPPADSPHVELLPSYAFHMSAQHIGSDDKRYVWDTNFGGELDLLKYGGGRATFEANYQAVLGEELRRFDPNQGNYILAGVVSGMVGGLEIGVVYYHQSRHLSDRPKVVPVDWNMLGGRIRKEETRGRLGLVGRADLRRTLLNSFVDYSWELDSDLHLRYALHPRASVIATSGVRLLGTDGSRGRGTQAGVREEGGIRIEGRGAAIEVFVSLERRIDPYPLEFGTATWLGAGFRLLGR